jgi:signal transduction histidine kinase
MFHTFRRESERPKAIELNDLITQVVQMLGSTAAGREVALSHDAQSAHVRAVLPEGEVKQVLYNLGRNAIQACAAGQSVTFRAEQRESWAVLTVTDEGSGIDDETLPFIFAPYFSTRGDAFQWKQSLARVVDLRSNFLSLQIIME